MEEAAVLQSICASDFALLSPCLEPAENGVGTQDASLDEQQDLVLEALLAGSKLECQLAVRPDLPSSGLPLQVRGNHMTCNAGVTH